MRSKARGQQDLRQIWTLPLLEGKVDPAILAAPRIEWNQVGPESIRYLVLSVAGTCWINQLALLAGILTSYARLEPSTVFEYLGALHARWRTIFPAYDLTIFASWQPEIHIPRYMSDQAFVDSFGVRQKFLHSYVVAARYSQEYLLALPPPSREVYRQWELPRLHQEVFRPLSRQGEVFDQAKQQRKLESSAVTPLFAEIRHEAHLRWNELWRFYTKMQEARQLVASGQEQLPLAFSYEELRWGRLHFVLWDRPSFMDAQNGSHRHPAPAPQIEETKGSPAAYPYFLEFVRAERLNADNVAPDVPGLFWFSDLIKDGLLGAGPRLGSEEEIAQKQMYLRSWGYGDDDSSEVVAPFFTGIAGLLSWPQAVATFMTYVQRRAKRLIVPVESLVAAATFGLAALEVLTTTGARMNELLQVSFSRECLQTLEVDGQERLVLRLIPKGAETAEDYFVGQETKATLEKIVRLLSAHYGLNEGETIPQVPFYAHHARAHIFPPRAYIFQYNRFHLAPIAITACLRFLLHGIVFQTPQGQTIPLTAHLFRHAFATHMRQVEKLPLELIATILHHKDIGVTAYYAASSQQDITSQRVSFLDRFATHLGSFDAFVARAPTELSEQLEEARQRVGTLMRVPGGQCTCHAICPLSFACTGCVYKVTDPSYREDLLQQRQCAVEWLQMAEARRIGPDIAKMRTLIQRADVELEEMRQIEDYRNDEQRQPLIQIKRRPKQGTSLASSPLRGKAAADDTVGPVYRRSTGNKG